MIRKTFAALPITLLAMAPFFSAGQSATAQDGQLLARAELLAGTPYPSAITADAAGTVYIVDGYCSCIRKVTSSGITTIAAGNGVSRFSGDGGPAISAELNHPSDIAADNAGNLYIADTDNFRIRKISTDGTITTIAGTGRDGNSGDGGPALDAQLNRPRGIAVDAKGNLFIADSLNARIRRIDASGIISTIAGGGKSDSADPMPSLNARLRYPIGIAVDDSGAVYFSDSGAARIRKVDSNGQISTIAGTGMRGFNGERGLAIKAQLSSPLSIAVDPSGNVFVADTGNSRLRVITADGNISTVAGNGTRKSLGDGGPATVAQLDSPYGIEWSPNGIFIVDAAAGRIRVVKDGLIAGIPGEANVFQTNPEFFARFRLAPENSKKVGDGVRAPNCKTPEPDYSEEARRAGVENSVSMDVVVSTSGTMQVLKILHPIGFGMDDAAVKAVENWKCTPVVLDGMPVNVLLQVYINFHLY
jgi:TonB family protein